MHSRKRPVLQCQFVTLNLDMLPRHLYHPSVARMLHFVRYKSLPFSTEDVQRVCSSCSICAELNPQFYCPERGSLIKATKPFERLSLDFKGPLPSHTRNTYLLVIVDEYTRFVFRVRTCCHRLLSNILISCFPCVGCLIMFNLTWVDRLHRTNLKITCCGK